MNNLNDCNVFIPSTYNEEKNYFIIEKNNWKNSIDIIFNTNIDNLNIINFFLILKSYIYSSEYIIKGLYLFSKNIENINITYMIKQLDPYIIYKINFIDFISLINNIITFENNYENDMKLTGLRIIFFNNIDNKIKKPIYPWNKTWLILNNIHNK